MGPTLTAADLQGRPAIIVLWNAGSTSSLACFQKLNAWDAELSDFGLVSIAVHMTGTKPQEIQPAAEARNVMFSVTEARWITGVLIDEFNQFPLAFVFNRRGTCVFAVRRSMPKKASAPSSANR